MLNRNRFIISNSDPVFNNINYSYAIDIQLWYTSNDEKERLIKIIMNIHEENIYWRKYWKQNWWN